jgi:hypothetical protein
VVAREGIEEHYSFLSLPIAGIILDPKFDLRVSA